MPQLYQVIGSNTSFPDTDGWNHQEKVKDFLCRDGAVTTDSLPHGNSINAKRTALSLQVICFRSQRLITVLCILEVKKKWQKEETEQSRGNIQTAHKGRPCQTRVKSEFIRTAVNRNQREPFQTGVMHLPQVLATQWRLGALQPKGTFRRLASSGRQTFCTVSQPDLLFQFLC